MKRTSSETLAVGTKGFIMRSFDNSCFFRVYHEGGKFTDYDIAHHDLEVQILDKSAVLVHHGDQNYVDYSATVLGYSDD